MSKTDRQVSAEQEEASQLWRERRYQELIALLGSCAESGAGWAYGQLGVCFQLGLGVERDAEVSKNYLEIAARTGDEPAPLPFAKMIFSQSRDPDSCARVRELLEEPVAAGDPASARLMADTYLVADSNRSNSDLQMAERYLTIAAEAADPESMHALGYLYEMSGPLQDLERAYLLYEEAADLGNPESAYNLALRYEQDRGDEDRQKAARHYYEIAVAGGVALAEHNLAAMYYDGRGGPVDYERSYQMYLAAARQGSYLSAFNISLLIRDGLVAVDEDPEALRLSWMLIALAQARALDAADPRFVTEVEDSHAAATESAKSAARKLLESEQELCEAWSSGALSELLRLDGEGGSETDDLRRPVSSTYSAQMRVRTDLNMLPEPTNRFLGRLDELELTDSQKHGLFVLAGLIAGVPREEEEITERQGFLQEVIPTDTETHIDRVVGDFYQGYERVLEEWLARSGYQVQFRDIVLEDLTDPMHVLKPNIHDVIDTTTAEINDLASAANLWDGFLEALGAPTSGANRTIKESFLCGVFQMLLIRQSDVSASQQLGAYLEARPPLVLGQCLKSINYNRLSFFNSAELEQIALVGLMSADQDYSQQFWGFQSWLLFEDGDRIAAPVSWDPERWHQWVMDQCTELSTQYKGALLPFSRSGHQLEGVPQWPGEISRFEVCDQYIGSVWGYSGNSIVKLRDILEYKALVAHVVYSSLTRSLETVQ